MKERIIGAVALVVIIVLVVPVFLDGPPNEDAMVTEPVSLPGQNEQARKRQTIVLERERDRPVPASRSASDTPEPAKAVNEGARQTAPDTTADRQPVAQPQKAAAPPQAAAAPASGDAAEQTPVQESAPQSGEASTTGMWAVQLGSFSNQDNAERLAAELRKSGYAAFLSQHQSSAGSLHRVRVGPQKDRDSAEAVAGKLSDNGHKGQVVPHP